MFKFPNTCLKEGFDIRISGQDVERGTFSHRHAVVKVEESEEEYVPLKNISKKQADFHIYNSLLSEYGVLGFEYAQKFNDDNLATIWHDVYENINSSEVIDSRISGLIITFNEDQFTTKIEDRQEHEEHINQDHRSNLIKTHLRPQNNFNSFHDNS